MGRNRAGAELSRVKQNRAERGQELGRNWGGARNVPDRSLKGAGQEYGRGGHKTHHSIKHGKRNPIMISRTKSLRKKCV